MAKLMWDQIGEKYYETGVDRGVIYPMKGAAYSTGEAWNGLMSVDEQPSGAEPTPLYANNRKYLELMSAEDFGMTIGAYTFPKGFYQCLGKKELAEIAADGKSFPVSCQFCDTIYSFTPENVRELLEKI